MDIIDGDRRINKQKRGKVLYTNVLHYKSLNAIISLSKQLEKKENVEKEKMH